MHDFFLADDLSGALDAAAAFHHAGRRVRVVLEAANWTRGAGDDVVAVTTETRNASSEVARRIVAQTLQRGFAGGGRLLYKKIDSTLRGPVAAELAALTEAMPATRILFTPANPRVGRTVRAGVLRVHGVPVAETDFARDPVWPVREGSIAKLLGDVAARVEIADAETEADLDAAVKRIEGRGEPWVAVGSGALAVAVAKGQCSAGSLQASVDREALARRQVAGATPQPVLMIGGSAHALNRTQAQTLAREHEVARCELEPTDADRAVGEVVARLRAGHSVALMLPATRIDSGVALAAISRAAARAVRESGVTRIFATGGETAFALCEQLGIRALEFRRELEPGLALAGAGDIWLAVKPGGFGDAQTWVRAWTELRAAR